MKKRGFSEGVDKDIVLGLRGLRVSLICLVVITIFLFVFLFVKQGSFLDLAKGVFHKPDRTDCLAIFAGFIVFIAVPFVLGVKLGVDVKFRKKKKKKS